MSANGFHSPAPALTREGCPGLWSCFASIWVPRALSEMEGQTTNAARDRVQGHVRGGTDPPLTDTPKEGTPMYIYLLPPMLAIVAGLALRVKQ